MITGNHCSNNPGNHLGLGGTEQILLPDSFQMLTAGSRNEHEHNIIE